MKRSLTLILCAGATLAWLAFPALGQGNLRIYNPSFENNFHPTWPYYGPIESWQGGGTGINDVTIDPGPFHNAGTPAPDGRRVGFKQGAGTLSAEVWDLEPGRRHWIQFRYDARLGSDLDLDVRFTGSVMDELLDFIPKVAPAINLGLPYYSRTVPFTPDSSVGDLIFEVTARGDSTLLLDAVTVVQRDEGNFVVQNPSFEASGVQYDTAPSVGLDWPAISGWAKTETTIAGVDDGTGGMADNGTIPEQVLVAFIDGEGSLSQTLSPLVPNDTYQVQFAYNAKSGTTAQLVVRVGDDVIWNQAVSPVGGAAAYRQGTASFQPTSDTATLSFVNTSAGGVVLLDDIKVLGATGTRLPPLDMAPARMLLRLGQEGTGSVTIPAERLAMGDTVIQIHSQRPEIFVLPDATADGVLSLVYPQSEANLTQSFRVLTTGVGSSEVIFVDSAGLDQPAIRTTVFVAGDTLVLNPSFELDPDSSVGTAPLLSGWTIGGGNVGMAETGNPFLGAADLAIPDRRQVLRMQGSSVISQSIEGLQPGRLYGLQFFYNGRTDGFPYELDLQVSFGGQVLREIQSIEPAAQAGRTSFYFEEVRFTPTEPSGLLEFRTVVTAGDATLFLDAVSIVPRFEGEIAVMNSSFEGSAMGIGWPGYIQPGSAAGWSAGGGGYGINQYSPTTFFVEPFLDNGINSDQDNVFFGQGAVSITQFVTGLAPNQAYTLVVDYNSRDGRGVGSEADPNLGQMAISLDGVEVFTSEEFPPVDTISPWPGFRHRLPFYQAFVPFTAFADSTELSIAHIGVVGDETLLIDNVRIVPGTRTPPVLTQGLTDQSADVGATVVFTVAATGNNLSYRWLRDGVALADGGSISGANTPALTLANVQPADAATYSALVTDGLGVVGSAAALTITGAPGEEVELAVGLVEGRVIIAWPIAAGDFRLQFAPELPAASDVWQDDPTPAVQEGDNWEVQIDPTEARRFYRLIP
jgi:hypothetical protein